MTKPIHAKQRSPAPDHKIIGSRQNPCFKLLKHLVSSSKIRREHQAAWIEGERLCRAFLENMSEAPPILVVRDINTLHAVDSDTRSASREVWVFTPALYAEVTQVETSVGWGLLIPQISPAASGAGDVVILDRLQDPGNVGSILRSAAAAGARAVWCISGTVDLWSPKVLRSAMGAHFAIHLMQDLMLGDVVDRCRDAVLPMLVTALNDRALSLFDQQLPLMNPVAWVFGQEGDGVSAEFGHHSTSVRIPQQARVESLNVAAAAAVCLFESGRRKRG